MGIWADIVWKDTTHVLFVKKKNELHPTETWKEDSIYKASKIFETLSPILAIEENI